MIVSLITPLNPFITQEGSTASASPGILAWLSLSKSFKDSIAFLHNSIQIKDREGTAEALIRVLNLPLGIVVSLDQFITFITLLISGASVITLSPLLVAGGLIFLTVELGLELYRLIRALLFSFDKDLQKIKTQLNENTTNLIPINQMARIVGSGIVNEILSYEPEKNTNSSTLQQRVNEQCNKALLVHIVGLAGIMIAMTTLVLAFLSFPPVPLITIGVVGLGLEFTRFFAPSAFIDERGYRWNFTKCLPSCLRCRH